MAGADRGGGQEQEQPVIMALHVLGVMGGILRLHATAGVVHCVALCCTVLHCVALCCTVLH